MPTRSLEVPVEGGSLHVGVWGTSGPVVLAAHGITASHVSFESVAEALGGGVRLVAPDLRGRGRSRDVAGPWGMEVHAADLMAVLDRLGEERADVLLGHSMGGFVGAVTAALHPGRVGALVMVDGGLPLMDAVPEGLSTEQLIHAVIGPAMERLDMTFPSVESYFDYWRKHPAFDAWSEKIERYVAYDLVGEPPELRPRTLREAVLGDTESQFVSDAVPRALAELPCPARLLRAPRGVMDADPLYPVEQIEVWAPRIPDFAWATVDDVNHYTIVMSQGGAAAVADALGERLTER